MNSVRVSVIVPVYNAKKYLQQCMDALLDQTCRDFEIILVDDGSTDGSAGLCDTFREKDSRVTVIHQANGGPGAARNAGLERASGEYVCFVDADDRVSRDYLLTLTEQMERSGADLVICAMTTEPEKLDIRESGGQQMIRKPVMDEVVQRNLIDGYMWNKLYRRSLIEEHGLRIHEQQMIWEDMLFVFQYVRHADAVLFIPDRLYFYRRHDGQLTSKRNKKSLFRAAQRVTGARLLLACGSGDAGAYDCWAHDLLVRNEITYIHAMLRGGGASTAEVQAELAAAWKAVKERPNPLIYKLKLWILSGMALGKRTMEWRRNRV